MFMAALFIIAKIWKQPVSINRWMDKDDVVYIYNGILLIHDKDWNFAICNNMDRLGGYYVKWNKSNRVRQILYDITYM